MRSIAEPASILNVPEMSSSSAHVCEAVASGTVRTLPTERWTEAALSSAPRTTSLDAAKRVPMLDLFVHVGTQLGRVVERVRFQEAFAEAIWQEQKRISEELHDNVGQELTGVGLMTSALVQKAAPVRDDLSGLAREISLGVQRASEKIRALARGLYSLEIDAQGLEPALQHMAATMNEIHAVPCRATCEGSADLNDDRTALHLFRIAQEAVTNAVRHARAREIVIDLRRDGGFLMLSVSDDGAGIDGVPREGKGLGLRIMRNRASAIGAVLSIKSAPGKGTAVTCALPLIHHEEGA